MSLLYCICCKLLSRFVGLEDRVAHALHGFLRHAARFLRAVIENIPYLPRIRLKFFALGLDGLDPFDQAVGHELLAIHAADGGGAALGVNAGAGFGRREQFVPGKYRADFWAPWVSAADALRVGHHVAGFGANLIGCVGEPDSIAVGFRHATAVEAGKAWGFGW